MEIWKDIDGFPGYQVSNIGRVRSHEKVTKSARFAERCWKDRIIKQKWQNNEARELMESCYQRKKTVLNPIINWTDEDVWEFIHKYDVPYCKLYDEGMKRLGCLGCPQNTAAAAELARYPKYKESYIRAFDKMLAERERENANSGILGNWRKGYGMVALGQIQNR